MSETNPMYGGDANVNTSKAASNRRWGVMGWKLIVIVISLLIITAGAVLFALGYISYGKSSGGVGSSKGQYIVVCDDAIIEQYNAAMFYKIREGSDTPTIDTEAVKNLKKQILDNAEYAKDPSCQALLFGIAINFEDKTGARAAYDALDSMHQNRIFPDSNIRGSLALFNQAQILAGLESTATEEQQ